MKWRKIKYILFHRSVLAGLALVAQVAVLFVMVNEFTAHFDYFYWFCIFVSFLATVWIVSDRSEPGYKIAWLVVILPFPVFGGILYLLLGGNRISERTRRKMKGIAERSNEVLRGDFKADRLTHLDEDAVGQIRYLERYASCPAYTNTRTEYFPVGDLAFVRMLEELEKAERYIFLEYFIVQEGVMWDAILEILKEKVKQGVEVRMIYDDMGCIMTLPYRYDRRLEALGIQCCVFNPFVPVLTSRLNNRDHRKICVIDGHTGFTGGINLADEYINAYEKHGHWKDTAVLLRGDAVWNLTVMFLSMWDYIHGIDEDFTPYKPSVHMTGQVESDGYVQPYSDNPLDGEPVGETVYLNLINRAKRYVYINTPYLILDNEMATALRMAAKSGVDVRIVTPHIPDKWYVHAVTRAYYEMLLESGVRIYEYTPGFVHAKTFVVDDEYATVGTVNLDYRSLYLHFECGVLLYRTSSVAAVKADYLKTLEVCQEVSLEECRRVPLFRRLGRAVLRVFAPLM